MIMEMLVMKEVSNMMTREELNEALQGEVVVTFTKADGTERVMRCTQNPDLMDTPLWILFPPCVDTPPTVSEVVRPPSDNVRVYDIEASGWRSFNMPTVKSVEVI